MIRAAKTSSLGNAPAGDALGRLVITISLTTGMSVVTLAAGLHGALGSGGALHTEREWSFHRAAVEPHDRPARVDLAGHLMPLPERDPGELPVGPGGGPVPADVAPADAKPTDAMRGEVRLALAAARPRIAGDQQPPADRLARGAATAVAAVSPPAADAAARSTARWFAAPAEPVPDAATDRAEQPSPDAGTDSDPVLAAERVVVQRGDTLLQILLRSGIDRAEAHEVVGTLSTVYDPRRLRVGQAMAVEVERAGDALAAPRLAALSLNLDFTNDLRVERDANGEFAARRVDRDMVQTVHAAHAVIDTSLYRTARRHAVPDEALVNLANIFSWDVDFQRDVHAGDSFELVYEQVESPDGEVRGGEVLYAGLRLRGRNVQAYRYEHADGSHGYYDAEGRSLRKWLMRTPIDGARLSSGFGPRRHPILGYNRMHRGVDFAAPTGTPIYAAGDGVLAEAGRNGAYGNYIRIKHNDEFSTAYAHMSRFADDLERGSRVRQGQIIAYVGTTGRSTGPHLHYEVLQNGNQINPMSIKPRTAIRLTGAELERFRRQIETIDAKRPTVGGGTTLALR